MICDMNSLCLHHNIHLGMKSGCGTPSIICFEKSNIKMLFLWLSLRTQPPGKLYANEYKQKDKRKQLCNVWKHEHSSNVKFNSRHDCGQMLGSNVHMDTRIFVPWPWWSGNSAWLMYEEAVVQFPTGSPLPSDHSVERELLSVQDVRTLSMLPSWLLELTIWEWDVKQHYSTEAKSSNSSRALYVALVHVPPVYYPNSPKYWMRWTIGH